MNSQINAARHISVVGLLGALAGLVHFDTMAQASDSILQIARALEGTAYVVSMNQYREGTLDSCGFEFKVMTFDNAYKRGAPIAINGSFALRKFGPKQVAVTYKVGTFNVSDAGGMQPEAPNYAWIKLGTVVVKPGQTMASDTPGYKLYMAGLNAETAAALDAIVEQRQVLVGFNRSDGGLDVVVPIDLSVRDTTVSGDKVVRKRDDQLGKAFALCLGELFGDMKTQ